MTGNPPLQPPGPEQRSDDGIDIYTILDRVEFPPELATPEIITGYILPAITAEFCDGEIDLAHAPIEDSVVHGQFGREEFRDGTFGASLRSLAASDDPYIRRHTEGLIRFAANVHAHKVVAGEPIAPKHHNINIYTQLPALEFSGKVIRLPARPELVIDYGPGLQGRFRIEEQIADLSRNTVPYVYMPISKGPYVSEFLWQYLHARYGDDTTTPRTLMRRGYYADREDGIASATNIIVEDRMQTIGTAEIADIVVASGVHSAGFEEVGVGIANAHKLLKPGGTLLIRAPKHVNVSTPGDVPAETMVDMATTAGFDQRRAQFFDITTGNRHSQNIQSLAAVFRK